jgi:hypothetical protein
MVRAREIAGTNHSPAIFCGFTTRFTGILSPKLLEFFEGQVSKKRDFKILFRSIAAEEPGVAGIRLP